MSYSQLADNKTSYQDDNQCTSLHSAVQGCLERAVAAESRWSLQDIHKSDVGKPERTGMQSQRMWTPAMLESQANVKLKDDSKQEQEKDQTSDR